MSACATYRVEPIPETRWYAVKVRSRCELAIASVLRDKQYEVMTPSFTEQRQYSDRIRRMHCSLFPGYIFVAMDPEKTLNLVSTEGVHYIVRSGVSIQPLTREEIQAINAFCDMDAQQSQACRPCPYLTVGQRVRIEAGSFAGLEGVLISIRNVNRIVVTVESLHSSVSIEIGHTKIRVLDAPIEMSQFR